MSYRLHPDGPVHELRHDRPGKVYVDLLFEKPGDHVRGHEHAFDHVMRVKAGALLCVVDGVQIVLSEGDEFTIAAGKVHELRALSFGTHAECEHEIRAENGEVMPEAFAPDGVPLEWVRRLTA